MSNVVEIGARGRRLSTPLESAEATGRGHAIDALYQYTIGVPSKQAGLNVARNLLYDLQSDDSDEEKLEELASFICQLLTKDE